MLKSFLLAFKLFLRELRAGEWLIIFFALLLAITAITGLHFYTDRLERGLEQQSAKLLGGNLVVTSSTPIPTIWLQKAAQLQIQTAQVWVYPSVVAVADKLQLVNIQAVSANYPLLNAAPLNLKPQQIFVDTRLLAALNIALHSAVTIGAANFQVQGLFPSDVDMVNTGFIIAPRLLMRIEDVPATKTVIPGSRVDYRLLLAGNKQAIARFQHWITPNLTAGQTLLDVNNQRFPVRDTISRADNYIQLVLLVCLLLSGVAIALSVRQYLQRHYDHVALWRCLGAQEKQITHIFIWQLLILALFAGGTGILCGYALQALIAHLFNQLLQIPLPAAGTSPILLGFITSLLLLFSYAYPVLSELPRTSPLFIWRKEMNISPARSRYTYITLGILLLYVYWSMDFSLLVLFFIAAILLSIGFLYVLSILVLRVLQRIVANTDGAIRRGLSQLVNSPESASMQLTAFTLILMTLILLGMVRNNLITHWQESLPTNTPNYFAINIAPSDVPAIQRFFRAHHANISTLYPIVRGRLIALNAKPIMTAIPAEGREHNALHRELNLSWMLQYPSDNKIVAGHAWNSSDQGKPLASVERNLASDLHLKLGDKLRFQIGDQFLDVVISNIRSVDWTSFHPNFFIIFPPGVADNFPTTYITSFYLPANQTVFLNQLVQQFPNITVIDVADILRQIQALLGKIGTAIEYLFLFAAGLGILIFITSVQASMDERRETYQILRILGASKKYILQSVLVEFICLGILIILFGFLLAKIIAYLVLKIIFAGL